MDSKKVTIHTKLLLRLLLVKQGQKLFIRTEVRVSKCYHSKKVLNVSDIKQTKRYTRTLVVFQT